MQRVLDALLRRLITEGRLEVHWPDRSVTTYEGSPGGSAAVALTDAATVRRLVLNPSLALGEAYMAGGVVPVECSLYELLDLLVANATAAGGGTGIMRLRARLGRLIRYLAQYNPAPRARRNAAHHYDLNGRLYSLFLDRDRQYSCAYFRRGDETIDEAQVAKKRHIAAKLLLDRPDLSVLDIGCGWGGLALTLARDYGARVLGITLSSEQLTEARARASVAGLADRVRFELLDYRAVNQQFDRIVSVGMFEHVGIVHYGTFFAALKRCLAPDGVALLHAIGRSDGPGATNRWIGKYIFPGGYSPALSEVLPAVERTGLWVTDVEILRLHYAETLARWRRRFLANRDTIGSVTDERFCRMWEFYLVGAELAFRREGHMVFQMQLAREQTAVPLTRDYISEADGAESQDFPQGKSMIA
ncbi:MAG TPA: cyclopropane-fatty-acyl-phospholipid synthase family protein [Acetobacteraceae bacterium]|nr:cyclopropane-fatty-acyl-phospholipid synthase family protein [Acetobacteraceae bacterium]